MAFTDTSPAPTPPRIEQYSQLASAIHWLSAGLIIIMFVLGFQMEDIDEPALKLILLRLHIILGLAVGALTFARVIIAVIEKRPGSPNWLDTTHHRLAKVAHFVMIFAVIILIASGIGMATSDQALPVILGEATGPLPNFHDLKPGLPHGLAVRILLLLLTIHVLAALYHRFAKGKPIFERIAIRR